MDNNNDDTLKAIKKAIKKGKNKLKEQNGKKANIRVANEIFKEEKKKINKNVIKKGKLLKTAINNQNREVKKQVFNKSKKLQREVNNLIGETTEGYPYKLYRILNNYLNPIIYERWKSIIFIILVVFMFLGTSTLILLSDNKGIYVIILVYIILYLFFINAMNIKMSCGKNTSLLELLNPIQSWKIFKVTVWNKNIEEYLKLINKYQCFKYDKSIETKEFFNRKNTFNIKNLNTNFNKKYSISGELNSKYPDRLPSKKYIFLTIYLFTVLFLLIRSIRDEFIGTSNKDDDKGKVEQIFNSIIVCLIFFIWTCVLDLPMWILIVLIIVLILIYLVIGSIDLYNSLSKPNIDSELLCKPHIIPFVNEAWAGVTFANNITNCMHDKSNGMFVTMMKPYLEIINTLKEQVTEQNSKLNNLGNVVDMFKDKVEKMIEPIYDKIKAIIDKVVKIKNKIYDIMNNIILMFKSMIWSTVNIVYAIESIHNILCNIPLVDCCFDKHTILKTIDNKDKLIKDIRVGDTLIDNSKVIGVLKFKYNNQKIYSYKGVIVTGEHFVYDNGVHKTIAECNESILINDYKKDYLYCLITSTQKIPINNIIFSDYFDIDNLRIQYDIQNKIILKLNNFDKLPLFKYKNQLPLWCFDKSTLIDMKDGLKKKIKDIQIGEETYYGKVIGLIQIKVNKSNIYKINDVITTGDQIINSNGIWMRVSDKLESKHIKVDDGIFYHLSIDTNKLLINNQIFTDFEQYNNYGYLEFIDKSPP
jgi:ABC-type multidrug transport system fused ATPase/permease subunit